MKNFLTYTRLGYMMLAMRVFVVLAIMLLPSLAMARPVSYPGGWTVMQSNDYDSNSLHIHYSPTAKYSVGYYSELMREENIQLHTVQYNRLLKRWNMPAAQANMYFKSNLGIAENDGDIDAAARVGFAADYETRRIFFSYENRYTDAGDFDAFAQNARVGFAPYAAEYDELNTWLMLQVDHEPERHDSIILTPIIRMFQDEYLWEIGVSDNKQISLNWIARF